MSFWLQLYYHYERTCDRAVDGKSKYLHFYAIIMQSFLLISGYYGEFDTIYKI